MMPLPELRIVVAVENLRIALETAGLGAPHSIVLKPGQTRRLMILLARQFRMESPCDPDAIIEPFKIMGVEIRDQ